MKFMRSAMFVLLVSSIFGVYASSLSAVDPVLSLSKTDAKIVVKIGDQVFAEYVLDDPATNKTYLWPVFGPTGKEMTRSFPMKDIEGEVKDHYHHRGIWFGHQDIGGFNSWAEEKSFVKEGKIPANREGIIKTIGSQKLRSVRSMGVEDNRATIVCDIDYFGSDSKRTHSEVRTLVFSASGKTRLIDFNQEFIASESEVTFGDEKDAGLCIRVPTTMSVDSKKGGRIVNSNGVTDKDAWSKRAKWCDYMGPVEDETLGVAILNHPTSFRHPTTWHVRTYGLFTANPFGTLDPADPNGPHTLMKGEKLELRHRFVLHDGSFTADDIEQAYKRYAEGK